MEVWPVNLIVAPASDPIGFPRFGERSLRAQLIEQCGVPVWTFGRNMDLSGLSRPVRNVACWLDFRPQKTTHLSFAIEYAHKLNAKLHLLRALPPIQEGSLHAALHKEIPPQQEGMAHDQVLRLCAGAPVSPEIHIAEGAGRGTFRRLLSGCDADVVFLRNEEMILTRWLGLGLPFGDNSPCPAVYVGDRLSVPVWNFERGPAARKDEVLHEGVSVPSRVAAVRNVRRVSTVLSDLGLL
jgi:hypothetical protein